MECLCVPEKCICNGFQIKISAERWDLSDTWTLTLCRHFTIMVFHLILISILL